MMATASQPESARPLLPATSSARMEVRPSNSPFTPVQKPSGTGSEVLSEKPSVKPSGSGYGLPELENLQWELNKFGGWEAWHVPNGAIHRRDKTYLGYLGKRQIAKLKKEESLDRFKELVVEWIAAKRLEKRI